MQVVERGPNEGKMHLKQPSKRTPIKCQKEVSKVNLRKDHRTQ